MAVLQYKIQQVDQAILSMSLDGLKYQLIGL
jgi:hypothetical protein